MPPQSIRNRIAAILLDSDVPLNATQVLERWPTRRKPTVRRISNLLASYREFIRIRWWRDNSRKQNEYTHIDHSLLSPTEEE